MLYIYIIQIHAHTRIYIYIYDVCIISRIPSTSLALFTVFKKTEQCLPCIIKVCVQTKYE